MAWGKNRRKSRKVYQSLGLLMAHELNLFIHKYRAKTTSNQEGMPYHRSRQLMTRNQLAMLIAVADHIGQSKEGTKEYPYPSLTEVMPYLLEREYLKIFPTTSPEQMAENLLLPPENKGDSYVWENDGRPGVKSIQAIYKRLMS